jgi:hypothetical protein
MQASASTGVDDSYFCGNRANPSGPSDYFCTRPCTWLCEQVGKDKALKFDAAGISCLDDLVSGNSNAKGETSGELLAKVEGMGYTFDDTTMEFTPKK